MASNMGWTVRSGLRVMAKEYAIASVVFAVISWEIPSIAGDNLKQVGMIVGVYLRSLFIVMPWACKFSS